MAATYSKPTKINEWADTGVVVEPSEAKKDSGWVAPELPPDTFFNWWQNLSGQWTKWLDERFGDGTSKDEFVIRNPDTGGEVMRFMSMSGSDGVRLFADVDVVMRKTTTDIVLWQFDNADSMQFDQINDEFRIIIDSDTQAWVTPDGQRLRGGLVIGSETLAINDGGGSGYQKLLQFGNPAFTAEDGEMWIGFFGIDDPVFKMHETYGVSIDALGGSLRMFHGSSASFFGFPGTPNVKFFGQVTIDEGVYLLAPLGGVPTDDYVKIGGDDFRISQEISDPTIWWNFTNDMRMYWDEFNDYLAFAYSGIRKISFGASRISCPDNDIDIGIVTSATGGDYFNMVSARKFVTADAPATASAPPNPWPIPHQINAQTCPYMICHMASNGVTPINLVHNVQSTVRVVAGQYTINPWVISDWGAANVFVTADVTGRICSGSMSGSGTSVSTRTTDSSGTLIDSEHSVIVYDGGRIS